MGNRCWLECEAAGHVASIVRKQRFSVLTDLPTARLRAALINGNMQRFRRHIIIEQKQQ